MKNAEKSFDYIIFAGKTKDDLHSISAWQYKDNAVKAAKRLLSTKVYKCIEVVFMPEYDDDTNEVVWSNFKR